MTYTTAEGRTQILDELASGIEQVAEALTWLSDAYERLDEDAGDRLEDELFRPVQSAYARAKNTHVDFAGRYRMPARRFPAPAEAPAGGDARDALERAAEVLEDADDTLAELQDSMLPVEVGDPELRAGLSDVRTIIAPLPARARDLARRFGR